MIPQGTYCVWRPGPLPGVDTKDGLTVRVVGIAQNPLPVLGHVYIVDLLDTKIEGYPYTHLTTFEVHLSPVTW